MERHVPAAGPGHAALGALIREGIELVGPDTPAAARLAGHAAFFDFVAAEMPEVLKRWEEYRAANLREPARRER